MAPRMITVVLAVSFLGLFFAPLSYGNTFWYDDSRAIDRRQTNQEWNVRQGVKSGLITHPEAERLSREQARTRDMEARMKSDGILTWQERASLNRELNRTATHIYQERYDGWYDRWQGGGWYNGRQNGHYERSGDTWQDSRNDGRNGGLQTRPDDRRHEPRQGRN